jgi:hypothetical protein
MNRGLIFASGEIFCSSSKPPDRLCGPPCLIFDRMPGLFPWLEIGRDVKPITLPFSRAEVKNECSYTSAHIHNYCVYKDKSAFIFTRRHYVTSQETAGFELKLIYNNTYL